MDENTVLIVEDNRSLSLAVAALAERLGLRVLCAPSLTRAREYLDHSRVHCILLDIGLPDGHGLDLLKKWQWQERPPVAVISAHGEIDNAITARQLGVTLFLDKPLDFDELQKFLLEIKSSQPKPPRNSPTFVGAAPAMRPVIRQIAHACASDQPVVIRGESGTGKTHVAALIASHSLREPHTPETIHATSLIQPGEMHEAITQTKGSLIIEHIDELALDTQQALARLIDQMAELTPRFIVTTDNEGLREKVSRGSVDSDLYYRLQVLEIHLPPLHERRDDLPALIDSLLGQLDTSGLCHFDDATITFMKNAPWHGNLRELHNAISHALVNAGGMQTLTREHLPSSLADEPACNFREQDSLTQELLTWVDQRFSNQADQPDYKTLISTLESRLLTILLERYHGKPSHLARALNINRATLRKKLQIEL